LREKGYADSQRDVNEGTINILRSMHAKLITMQGQTSKNSGYPYFDGTLGVPQVPQEVAHLSGSVPQGDFAEGIGEPFPGELLGQEGAGSAAL
jgi:hypothetical protein